MKKSNMIKSATSITLLAALALTGCSAASTSNASATATSATSTSASSTSDTTSKVADSFSTDVKSGAKLAEDTHYSAKDVTWDSSSEVTIDLSNPTATDGVTVSDGVITITKAGNYKLTGTYEGQIKVEATSGDMVRLILNNATITNSTGAAINVVKADEVVIYTASGTTNTVSDGSSYSDTASGSPDAAIYSKSDLTLAGEGTLKVEGKHEEGIHTTDGLVIASGTLEVSAANTGIKGKDYVDILDGTITVTATKDGIKATNDTDGNRGWVRLSGGTVNISAGDDGFKAERVLEISGGTLNITQANEGIEAQYINILDGTVNVTSSDDGINASYSTTSTSTESASASTTQTTQSKQATQGNEAQGNAAQGGQAPAGGQAPSGAMGSGTTGQPPAGGGAGGGGAAGGMGGGGGTFEVVDATINITGGTVTVNANGDGIDSNGTATLSGGTLIVNGPFTGGNASLDTNGDLLLNGATVTAGNSGDMFEAPSTNSTSGYVKISNVSNLSAGTTVQVADSSGNVVANYKVTNSNTALILVSSSKITKGQSYTVYTTTDSVDASSTTLASNATSLGSFTAS
ncbi:carbohydrate-binding domain-containing protein [uncultured Rothia sp.]|uniref:carbohydrate-binding domain-containing protein n=1 Tax=uncultured Rothia sp. TaxID=316088 RepID=UPI00288AFD26|nr:carbohydrate-binding domain-containing protein [uncultured Rothia sp.]